MHTGFELLLWAEWKTKVPIKTAVPLEPEASVVALVPVDHGILGQLGPWVPMRARRSAEPENAVKA